MSVALNLRNNNPGNIRPGENYQGEVGENEGFAVFSSMPYGIRAYLMVYHSYIVKDGVKTLSDFINRWAPPADNNDTDAYITSVSNATGLAPTDPMPTDQAGVTAVLKAQTQVEGSDAADLSDADIQAGFDLFNSSVAGFFLA